LRTATLLTKGKWSSFRAEIFRSNLNNLAAGSCDASDMSADCVSERGYEMCRPKLT